MRTLIACFVMMLAALLFQCMKAQQHSNSITLDGMWNVEPEPGQDWKPEWTKPIRLPGTLDDAGIGEPETVEPDLSTESLIRLRRKHNFVGEVCYTRSINIPDSWRDKNVVLTLERVLWRSRVSVNGIEKGGGESLVTPHVIELGKLAPGTHTLAIMVDNRPQYQVSGKANHPYTQFLAHAYTDETQIIWNGVLGKMTLDAYGDVRLGAVSLFASVENSAVEVQFEVVNYSDKKADPELWFDVISPEGKSVHRQRIHIEAPQGSSLQRITLPVANIRLWDEFSPQIYSLEVKLSDQSAADSHKTDFAFRTLDTDGTKLRINGHRLYLRGEVDCAVHPLTGYPPTDYESWHKIMATYKKFGLNHVRFHSWCPPEAAFRAADRLGIYLLVELPLWAFNVGQHEPTNSFLEREAQRIIESYGNHPSFCFWSLGNELEGDFDWMERFVAELRQKDSRRLYTTTTFTFAKERGADAEPQDDFLITQWTKNGWARCQGVFDHKEPHFDGTFSRALSGIRVPVVTHEIGQYSIFPDLNEIEKYRGNLIPVNLQAVHDDLKRKGRLDAVHSYYRATGAFSLALYKGEIEYHLRTPESNGFELLGIKDFPGQGTAIVGVIDSFGEEKDIVDHRVWKQFCSPVVPLLEFPKVVYTGGELFKGVFTLANHSGTPLKKAVLWRLTDAAGKELSKGKLPAADYPAFTLTKGDTIAIRLPREKAQKLIVEVKIDGTPHKNRWNIWCYPPEPDAGETGVMVVRDFEQLKQAIGKEKQVLFAPSLPLLEKGVKGRFTPVFWSAVHFPNQPGAMGILCDPDHPALTEFPTDYHADWQWWYLLTKSKNIELPEHLAPAIIVQVLDNIAKNRLMSMLFEVEIDGTRVVVCTTDIFEDLDKRLPAKQLGRSLHKYVASLDTAPKVKVTTSEFISLFQ